MGNGKLLQVLTLLLCLSFGYFTFKNYEDIKELRNENAFLRDTIDSLLCQPATANSSIKEGIGKPEKKSERNVAADKSEKKSIAKPAASMTSSSKSAASKPAPTGVVSFINELVGDAQEEYRAAKKANQNAPKKAVVPRLKVKSSYRMEDRYSYGVDDPQELGNAEGIVKLDITIDIYGQVKSAKLNSASTITDEEVIEACKKTALKTMFNLNSDAPRLQQGTITYKFYR
ncbi:putative uncharacterized protein [Bacteroides sp. CAG:545]|nr:putative uncharacterized protein [Bacteroides sp. CAG:545]